MRFNFKKIAQYLILVGLLNSTCLLHNSVEAMELPWGMNSLLSSDHKTLADNMINKGEIGKVVYVGTCYYVGDKTVGRVRDINLARIYFEAAALQNSDISKFILNKIKNEQKNIYNIKFSDEAIKEAVIGSVFGNIAMQTFLASAYYKGDRLPKDYESALFWAMNVSNTQISQAFNNEEQNYEYQVAAQYLVAIIYDHGNGVDCDPQMAFEYYKLAGENPYATSKMQYDLGLKYLHGDGTEIDLELGMKYLRAAKDKGHEGALEKTISVDLTKKALTSIYRAKFQNNTAYLLSLGNSNYNKFNLLFKKLKDIKQEEITEKEICAISDCAILLMYSVECENAIGKIMKETIIKANNFPGMNDDVYNILKLCIPDCILSFDKMKEIIKNEESTEEPAILIQAMDNTTQMPTKSLVVSTQRTRNNALPGDKEKNINVSNTTSSSRINNFKNKDLLDLSVNSAESLKKKITEKKVELNHKKATKKSAQKKLDQSKQELKQSEQELRQSEQELIVKQLSRTELVRKQIKVAKKLETLKLEVKDLVDSRYEGDTTHNIKKSPKNSDHSEAKKENKVEEKCLENPLSIQTTHLEKVEKREDKEHQDFGHNIPEKKQSITKTLKTKVKKWNDNREEKSKIREEKRELKNNKTKTNSSPVKIGNVSNVMGDKSSVLTNSVSQTQEESSFSVTENESQLSKTEASEVEKILPIEEKVICEEMKMVYQKLYRLLNKRDIKCLNDIKPKNSIIIYDTLSSMGQQNKVCGSWDGKNIHVQKQHHQDIVFNAHTTHGSSGYTKWYHNPEIIIDFITFIADCDDIIKDFCIWKFGNNCFSRITNDSAEAGNTSKPE